MPRRHAWLPTALLALALPLSLSSPAWAVSSSDAPGVAQQAISSADRDSASIKAAIDKAKAQNRTAEQRLADADVLLRTRDFARAITVLHEIVEKHPDHPTVFPDALSMLGEAYFQSRQLLSARRVFKQVADRSGESRMAPYAPKAFVRLVDIALKRQDPGDLDDALKRIGAFSGSEPTVQYAKGKALLTKRDFASARSALGAVPAGHLLHHQARYLEGVVAMREAQAQAAKSAPPATPGEAQAPSPSGRYAAAVELFRQVTQLAPDTPDHRRVIDMAWLAIGRLRYDADQLADAVEAYNHVDRSSSEFTTSLYELAWVYVRLGDTDRALRSLELLSILEPNNASFADGQLLRADLMLRAGQFDKSLQVYRSIRAEYDPMRQRVDAFLGSTSDPAVYYDKLASEQLDTVDNTSQLPSLAVQWAREERDGPAAFALLDDISQSRDLIRQSQILVAKLRSILNAPNRVRAFPELRAGDQQAIQLINRISAARGTLAQGLDDAEGREVSGEIARVREERRALQERLRYLPVTDADMEARDLSAQRQWNSVSQRLQQLQLEVDYMQAIVNGLRRLLTEGKAGVSRDPATISQWRAELEANERDLKTYKEQLAQTRRSIDTGRVMAGYGDQRFIEDDQARAAFREKLTQELQLAQSGAAGSAAADFANRAMPVMAQALESEKKIVAYKADIDTEVTKRVTEVSGVVEREAANIINYSAKLDALDQEARLVVGQVAFRNFTLVRDRLRNIVLHADVGAVEQAWEVREEQMMRVINLRRERDREDRLLQEELKEVLDDSADPTSSP